MRTTAPSTFIIVPALCIPHSHPPPPHLFEHCLCSCAIANVNSRPPHFPLVVLYILLVHFEADRHLLPTVVGDICSFSLPCGSLLQGSVPLPFYLPNLLYQDGHLFCEPAPRAILLPLRHARLVLTLCLGHSATDYAAAKPGDPIRAIILLPGILTFFLYMVGSTYLIRLRYTTTHYYAPATLCGCRQNARTLRRAAAAAHTTHAAALHWHARRHVLYWLAFEYGRRRCVGYAHTPTPPPPAHAPSRTVGTHLKTRTWRTRTPHPTPHTPHPTPRTPRTTRYYPTFQLTFLGLVRCGPCLGCAPFGCGILCGLLNLLAPFSPPLRYSILFILL